MELDRKERRGKLFFYRAGAKPSQGGKGFLFCFFFHLGQNYMIFKSHSGAGWRGRGHRLRCWWEVIVLGETCQDPGREEITSEVQLWERGLRAGSRAQNRAPLLIAPHHAFSLAQREYSFS